MLSEQAVAEFKRIFEVETGETLNDLEAHELALELVTFFEGLAELHNQFCSTVCPKD